MPDYEPLRQATAGTLTALLLGPLDAAEVIPSAPVDTYLTGILWPRGESLDAIEDDANEGVAGGDDPAIDEGVPGYRSMRPCSIGLTFAADAGATIMVGFGSTARYEPVETEPPGGGRPVLNWRRRELGFRLAIAPGEARTWRETTFLDTEGAQVPGGGVELHIRRRREGAQQIVTLTLINATLETDDIRRDEACLFQTELVAEALSDDGRGLILPRTALPPVGGDEDEMNAALLYRGALEYAVGHGIATQWPVPSGQRVARVSTSWVPSASVKGMDADGHESLADFHRTWPDALNAAWLGGSGERSAVIDALNAFSDVYERWIADVIDGGVSELPRELQATGRLNAAECRSAASRVRAGISVLAGSDEAWTAFQLANAAMDRQARYSAKRDRARPLRWRPFQLAYFLLVLPGLVAPSSDEDRDTMDLLWFPTGGGKTEAYLGLTAFQILLRRLTEPMRRQHGGVDVLMRYTLRLLTVQQFQRAASLICACEAIRRERDDLGAAPINLGLYVGGEATPNRTVDAGTALAEEHDGQAPRSTPRQLLACPVCDTPLAASDYAMSPGGLAIDINCSNAACETHGHPLPIQTVDDFIYDVPPSLLIGTIDKFAQLPRRRDLRVLFGLDGDLRPGLIIQDELHLISGPLGSMAGLYEAAIDLLCTKDGVRPKVIGSTATIGQAARQVRALFDRDVLQFPPPGIDAGDSFFAVTDLRGADRVYMSVSTAGRSPKFALQAVAAALLQSAGTLLERGADLAALDPYWTCVLYFNSLRELGGAHVLMQDDVPRQMEFLASRLSAGRRPLEHEAVELSSRVASRDLPDKLKSLDAGLNVSADPYVPDPQDVVLASNMISVGVDVPRLGLMVVNGQPKSTAEYIQATSRIGRGLPGLVITLYNFGRPRDVSHFEHFQGYHSALYRSVEATSVTPWAPRARDKALHAVLAASIRHLVSGMDQDDGARDLDPSEPAVAAIIAALGARARSSSVGIEGADAAADLHDIVSEWAQRARDSRAGGRRLVYWERKAPFGATLPHLMTSAEEGGRSTRLSWPTPNSMREVEPSTAFSLKTIRRS